MFRDQLRKWVFISLGVLFLAQLYFVQELFAALLFFAAIFLAIATFVALVYLVTEGGQRAVAWTETQWRALLAGSRRALAFSEALSKKTSPRPHSDPAP